MLDGTRSRWSQGPLRGWGQHCCDPCVLPSSLRWLQHTCLTGTACPEQPCPPGAHSQWVSRRHRFPQGRGRGTTHLPGIPEGTVVHKTLTSLPANPPPPCQPPPPQRSPDHRRCHFTFVCSKSQDYRCESWLPTGRRDWTNDVKREPGMQLRGPGTRSRLYEEPARAHGDRRLLQTSLPHL